MRCGKCHTENVTIDHVKACYQVGVFQPLTTVHGDGRDGQYQLLQRLLAERDMTPLGPYDEVSKTISKQAATEMIGDLINNHRRQKPAAAEADDIPAGYYATPSITGNQDLDFWHVQRPTEGKWAGYVFVKRVVGGHADMDLPRDSRKKVKSERIRERATQFAALEAIRKFGVEKSHELFGIELKFCRECGIHLTDETSRALGIGPYCRGAAA